jgi:hypothetical protein
LNASEINREEAAAGCDTSDAAIIDPAIQNRLNCLRMSHHCFGFNRRRIKQLWLRR